MSMDLMAACRNLTPRQRFNVVRALRRCRDILLLAAEEPDQDASMALRRGLRDMAGLMADAIRMVSVHRP